jgi:uncharacterized membrane protein
VPCSCPYFSDPLVVSFGVIALPLDFLLYLVSSTLSPLPIRVYIFIIFVLPRLGGAVSLGSLECMVEVYIDTFMVLRQVLAWRREQISPPPQQINYSLIK